MQYVRLENVPAALGVNRSEVTPLPARPPRDYDDDALEGV
jgi:hypothetical protein